MHFAHVQATTGVVLCPHIPLQGGYAGTGGGCGQMQNLNGGIRVHGISEEEAAKYETLFMLLDSEGNGAITEKNLADLMPRMGVFQSEDELHSLFMSVDVDGSGLIDFYEFLTLIAHHREATQLALLEGGRDCFKKLKAASKMSRVIRPDDPLLWGFDIIMLLTIVLWLGIVTYEDVRQHNAVILDIRAVKLTLAAVYVLDIAKEMFTSRSPEGTDTLPVDSIIFARENYLHSRRFLIDSISALPVDIVLMLTGHLFWMRIFQNLRLVKLLVVTDLLRKSPRDTITPTYTRFYFFVVPLCRICFWALFAVHILSVVWLILAPESSYINAVYVITYTITTTGFNAHGFKDDWQRFYAVLLFVLASVFTGLVVGKLVQFSQQADLQTDANKRMLETLAALNHLTIPSDFKEEVLAFQLHRLKHSNSLFNEAISGLPDVMQDRMALYARMKIVRQVPIFQEAPEICVAKLAQSLVNVFVPPEEFVVIAGEEGEEMFFLFHGMCGVMLPDGKWVATIKRGGVFGEVALLQATRRSASIKSLTYCQLFRLDKVCLHCTRADTFCGPRLRLRVSWLRIQCCSIPSTR